MNFSKPFGPSATETSEVEVEGNIRELARGGAVFRQGENGDSEMSVTALASLLRRVSGNSRREIDTLIGELADAAREAGDRQPAAAKRYFRICHAQPAGDAADEDHLRKRAQASRRSGAQRVKCGTKYISVAKKRPPVVDPRCEVCDQPFPRMKSGRWLHYQRADDAIGPETTLRGS